MELVVNTENNFPMDESISNDIPKVSKRENEIFTAPFEEEKVRKAIFQMEQKDLHAQMASQQNFIRCSGK